jgi:5-methylcytosine-specific restriction endonuclease McrA
MIKVKFLSISYYKKCIAEPVMHTIDIEEDSIHSGSWASAVLLRHQYDFIEFKESLKKVRKERRAYSKFRRRFLKNEVKEKGTLSHVQPLSRGGKRLDPDNIVVACSPCNSRRGTKDFKSFKRQMELFVSQEKLRVAA